MPILVSPSLPSDLMPDAFLSGANARSRLQRLLRASRRALSADSRLAILLFELDKFHGLFDLCGPAGIDRLLHIIDHDRLSRLGDIQKMHIGGGAFICLVPFADDNDLADSIDQLRTILSEPMWIDLHIVHLTVAIGVVIAQADDLADNLLHAASLALTHAQRAGENMVSRFHQDMFAHLHAQVELEGEFRSGLLLGQIVPYYQPIVALAGGTLKGFEALARWQHPRLGILPPSSFLPLVREMKLGGELLLTLLRQLCRDASEWPNHLTISINISPEQLCDSTLAPQILRVVYASGLDPRRLIIEITEESSIDNPQAASDSILSFRRAGIGLALDDFGSGHASFDRLSHLEIDQLKIDRTLIQAMDRERGRKLVEAIVNLGRTLAMTVTAEGIETTDQAHFSQRANCDWGQGYLFGEAVPSETARDLANSPPRYIY